jgi:hypothetical protein
MAPPEREVHEGPARKRAEARASHERDRGLATEGGRPDA